MNKYSISDEHQWQHEFKNTTDSKKFCDISGTDLTPAVIFNQHHFEREKLLDYYARRSAKFNSSEQLRSKIIRRSRKNLKTLKDHLKQSQNTTQVINLERDPTSKAVHQKYFAENFSTHSSPFQVLFTFESDSSCSNSTLNSSSSQDLVSAHHNKKSKIKKLKSKASTAEDTESDTCATTATQPQTYNHDFDATDENTELKNEQLRKYRYWPTQRKWQLLSMKLFKKKIESIAELTEELLQCLYNCDNLSLFDDQSTI